MEFITYLRKRRMWLSKKEIAKGSRLSDGIVTNRIRWYSKPSIDMIESKYFRRNKKDNYVIRKYRLLR